MSERAHKALAWFNGLGGVAAVLACASLIITFGNLPERVHAVEIHVQKMDDNGTIASQKHEAEDKQRLSGIDQELEQQREYAIRAYEELKAGRTERYNYQAKNDSDHATIMAQLTLLVEEYKKARKP
jgi:hypothetical protein